MKLLILLSIICISNIGIAQEHIDKKFPDSYLGKYKGELKISTDKGDQMIPMKFHLLATDSIGRYDYTIIYGEGEKKQIRSYTLLKENDSMGNYTLDENNGILLDAKVIDNKLFFLFEVMGSLITTYLTFGEDHLLFEVVAAKTNDKTVSGGLSEEIPEVISYPVGVVQSALLYKE